MDENAKNILEPGGTEVATAAGGARRYRKPLKSFRWCDIKLLLGDSFGEWNRHKAPRLGASLAFYTLLSLAPLLLVVVSMSVLCSATEPRRARSCNESKISSARRPPKGFRP